MYHTMTIDTLIVSTEFERSRTMVVPNDDKSGVVMGLRLDHSVTDSNWRTFKVIHWTQRGYRLV